MRKRKRALEGDRRPYFRTQYFQTNGENIAVGLRTPGAINLFKSGFKEQGGFRFGWEKLMKYHGVASGVFTADDAINGSNPTQGTTLTAICELLTSLEVLAAMGDVQREIPDIFEKIAFNALPAAWSRDMRRSQRLEQVNQVLVSKGERAFYNADDDALLYQEPTSFEGVRALSAWPKLVSHLWYATADGGLWAMSYAPLLRARAVGGCARSPARFRRLSIFRHRAHRSGGQAPGGIPALSAHAHLVAPADDLLAGWEIMQVRAGETACVRRRWQTGDVVRLELSCAPHVSRGWYHQSAAIELGPLLMALAPEPHAGEDGRIETPEEWGWALVRDEPMKTVRGENADAPFKDDEPPRQGACQSRAID